MRAHAQFHLGAAAEAPGHLRISTLSRAHERAPLPEIFALLCRNFWRIQYLKCHGRPGALGGLLLTGLPVLFAAQIPSFHPLA